MLRDGIGEFSSEPHRCHGAISPQCSSPTLYSAGPTEFWVPRGLNNFFTTKSKTFFLKRLSMTPPPPPKKNCLTFRRSCFWVKKLLSSSGQRRFILTRPYTRCQPCEQSSLEYVVWVEARFSFFKLECFEARAKKMVSWIIFFNEKCISDSTCSFH